MQDLKNNIINRKEANKNRYMNARKISQLKKKITVVL